jgi:tetratricopeptide (TPR) repeat protein
MAEASLSQPTRAARHEALRLQAGVLDRAIAGGAALVTIFALAVGNGGYFATAWGWAALGLLWLAVIAFLTRSSVEVGALELLFVGGLAAFAAWIAIGIAWSEDVSQTVLELQRMLIYVAGALAFLLVVKRSNVRALLGGILAAIFLAAGYGLATRLFPDRLGRFDPDISVNRLAEPLGYWNALGLLAAFGVVLAIAFAARSESVYARALAGASTVVLMTTFYFTFGRAVWITLGIAIAIAIALDPRRLQLVTTMLALAPASAAAIALASRSDALTHTDVALSESTADGHRLALWVAVLSTAAAAAPLAIWLASRRLQLGRPVRLVYGAALAMVVLATAVGLFVHYGPPWSLAHRAYDSFTAPSATPPQAGSTDLNDRLFSLGSNGRVELWRVGWSDVKQNPWLGSGPGTFELQWYRDREIDLNVRDAHSLYLEVLAETGPIGLAVLLLALLTPLAAAFRARANPLASVTAAAYAAYLLHAGQDWDWEMPVVTLTAILLGIALLRMRGETRERRLSMPARTVAVAALAPLAAFAFMGLISNTAIASSDRALDADKWEKAEASARRATRWAPWSSTGWDRLGEAELGRNDVPAALESFRKALAKDPNDWDIWLDYAAAASGRERMRALARAAALNPRGQEVHEFRQALRKHQEPPWFL